MNKPVILIIEDDDYQYEIYEEALVDYRLVRVTAARDALKIIAKDPPNLIVLDHILAKGDLGLDYLPTLKDVLPHVPIVIVSGVLGAPQQREALQGPRRAHYCIAKPVDLEELKQTIRTALEECGEKEVVRSFEALERSKRVDVEALLSRSTDRLSRQTKICQLLRGAKERPNISALARDYKVARRTIIRDLQELIRRGQLPSAVFPKWETGGGDDEEED
jgi:DNA-binding NtrC family response regulator